MKCLVDAQLPPRLCAILRQHGHDAIHTLDLPEKNATADETINQISCDELRVVISKDSDFYYSHLLRGRPWKLLLLKTGNSSSRELCNLFERNLPSIEAALQDHTLVEVDHATVTPVV